MLGMGCRAPSVAFVRSATLMRLLPCYAAGCPSGSRKYLSPVTTEMWKSGSKVGFLGDILGFGDQRNGSVAVRRSPHRSFVRAINVSGPGAVDSPLMKSMQTKIKEDLNAESVTVKDAYGDGRHVSIDVVASVFEGKSAVNRQRLVYKAIWEELQETVHAVDQLKTRTPSEAANSPDQL